MRQGFVAAGAGFAGTILLLFLGTQILDWNWVVAVCLGSFLFGLYRTLRRIPSPYRLAQQVDTRLALDDCLSTAYYFSDPQSNGNGSRRFRASVLEQAIRLCEGITAKAAAPIRLPRSAHAALALALAAAGMFYLRYAVRGSLDLRPPMAPSVIDYFRPTWLIADSRTYSGRRPPAPYSGDGITLDPEKTRSGDPDAEVEGPSSIRDSTRGEAAKESPADDSSSLLDKMKNAFKDMLDKLGIEPEPGEQTTAAKSGEGDAKQSDKGGEKKQSEKNDSPDQGTIEADEEANAAGPTEDKVQSAKKNSDRKGEDAPGGGEGSGIGENEGEKQIQEAAELAAMGKITELLGKRQANLTGEVMVEVTTSKQQKATAPYTDASAAHGEGGGEIHRDEVPLLYQQYVQQYFEQVHKAAPAAAPANKQ